jgi:hypothetical protein
VVPVDDTPIDILVGLLAFLTLCLFVRAFIIVLRLARDPSLPVGTRFRQIAAAFGVCLLSALLTIWVNLPASGVAREAKPRSQCNNNLKQIMLAMHNYCDKYGRFPPAYTVDRTGRPVHTWRVLLLPFLGQGRLYQRLRLDEPYDSPHNQAVFDSIQAGHDGVRSMPRVFRCPVDKENRTDTNYVMIVGPRTISNGSNSVGFKDITDGTSNTIAVVETYGLGIRWYEPRDLRADEMSFRINDPEHYSIASRHPGGANVAVADVSVRFLPEDADPRALEATTTISGGEDVSELLDTR